jgi:hypothetical protein
MIVKPKKTRDQDVIRADQFEVEELRAVLFGESDRLSPELALSLLGRKTYPGKLTDMQRVLLDEKEASRLRQMAAVELSRMGTDESLEVLMRAGDVQDEFVLRGVMKGLSTLGDRRSLDLVARYIDTAADTRDRAALNQAAHWTATLISYRLGAEGFEVDFPKRSRFARIDPEQAQPIEWQAALSEDVEEGISSLSAEGLGFKLQPRTATALQCADRRLMLLFSADITRLETTRQWVSQKSVLGVVALRDESGVAEKGHQWKARYYLLTQPIKDDEGQFHIFVTNTRGTLILAGTARLEERQVVAFTLRAVQRPGMRPVGIDGVYRDGNLSFERIVSGQQVQKRITLGRREKGR